MTESILCTVHDPDRIANFETVFGTATVPVTSPLPQQGNLPGLGTRAVYLLDLAAITPDQRSRLVEYLSSAFGLPVGEVERDLNASGMPILADNVTITLPPGLAIDVVDTSDADYDEDDEDGAGYAEDDGDDFDRALSECGMTHYGLCLLAGSEFCDWECPIDWDTINEMTMDEMTSDEDADDPDNDL